MLYVWIILSATVIIGGCNALFVAPMVGLNWWELPLISVLLVLSVIAIDGVVAFLVNRLPKKWFNHNFKFFTVGKREKLFYEKMRIRKWKDKIPELGALGGFRKNHVLDPFNNEYVEKYLLEVCYGEIVHVLGCLFGFLVMCIYPKYYLTIGLPVAVVNAVMNIPSLIILRYNSHKLEVLYKSNKKREERAKGKEEEEKLKEVAVAK